jgi:hypothetical protein
MLGRTIRLVAATAALTFAGLSAASAGWYGSGCCGAPLPAPVNWGCASAGCAPIAVNWCGSCAPVQWGCGSCGPSYGYGYGYGYGRGYGYGHGYGYGYGARYAVAPYGAAGYDDDEPVHVAYQGPTYDPPRIGYTYPAYSVRRPIVRGYGYRHLYRAHRVAYRGVYMPRRVGGPVYHHRRAMRPAYWGK